MPEKKRNTKHKLPKTVRTEWGDKTYGMKKSSIRGCTEKWKKREKE